MVSTEESDKEKEGKKNRLAQKSKQNKQKEKRSSNREKNMSYKC